MIEIFIEGQPPAVTHQSGLKARGSKVYKTAALRMVENAYANAMKDSVPARPLEGALKLSVEFGYHTTKNGRDGEFKTTRPDTDNLIKSLKDVMTRMGFWLDDAQIASESVSKRFTSFPGIRIRVEEICQQSASMCVRENEQKRGIHEAV